MNRDDKAQDALFSRTRTTWLLYVVTGCFGYLLNGLGAILQPLREQLGVSGSWVGAYPTLLAAGLLLVGLVGDPIARRLGRDLTLRVAMVLLVVGVVVLCVPHPIVSIAGAAVAGAGGALLIQTTPTALAAAHPTAAPVAIGEANALSSIASVLAPLAVAAGLATGLGWPVGYLLPVPFLLVVVVLLRADRGVAPTATVDVDRGAGHFGARWFDVLLAVSVEFCLVFWSATALQTWTGMAQSTAIALSSAFLVGMAAGRTVSGPVLRRLRTDRNALVVACATALAGFALFWSGAGSVVTVAGLLVTGLGVALLYPITLARAIAARPDDPDRAAARCALASGLAIGGAPLLLALLAQYVDLRVAYLIAPALLAVVLVRTVTWRAGRETVTA